MNQESYDTILQYWDLKDDVLFPFDEEKVRDFPNEEESILSKRRRFDAVKQRLSAINREDIDQCKSNLMQAIDKVIEIISESKLGYPLARNQGLIIENYVYGKLLSIIHGAVKSPAGYGYPNFYSDPEGDFDSAAILQLINSYKEQIQNTPINSYSEFANLFERFRTSVIELWKNENRTKAGRRF